MKTHIIECKLAYDEAEAFNRESARIYNNVLINHWRIYRKKRIWLSRHAAERLEDYLGGPTFLHAHSRDAAQQGFYKACATTRSLFNSGLLKVKYPYKHKAHRTTIWKKTAIRIKGDYLLLSNARRRPPIRIKLPSNLKEYGVEQFREVRLVRQKLSKQYEWHIVTSVLGVNKTNSSGTIVIAINLGEVHPATATDGNQAVVFCAREMRAINQYTNKRLGKLKTVQAKMRKRSARWCKVEKRKVRFLVKQRNRIYDIEHKISRAVVDWAIERRASKLIVGDRPKIVQSRYLTKILKQKVQQKSVSHFFIAFFIRQS